MADKRQHPDGNAQDGNPPKRQATTGGNESTINLSSSSETPPPTPPAKEPASRPVVLRYGSFTPSDDDQGGGRVQPTGGHREGLESGEITPTPSPRLSSGWNQQPPPSEPSGPPSEPPSPSSGSDVDVTGTSGSGGLSTSGPSSTTQMETNVFGGLTDEEVIETWMQLVSDRYPDLTVITNDQFETELTQRGYAVHWDLKLGEGKYGIVYLASRDHPRVPDERECLTIKRIKEQGSDFNAIIHQEVTISMSLRHHHVVRVHDVFGPVVDTTDQHAAAEAFRHFLHHYPTIRGVFLIQEYLPGPTVSGWYNEICPYTALTGLVPMSRPLIRSIVDMLATGLGYLHSEGIIHGDLHANNMMFDQHGTLKIIDFGFAVRDPPSERVAGLWVRPPRFPDPDPPSVGQSHYQGPTHNRVVHDQFSRDLLMVGRLVYNLKYPDKRGDPLAEMEGIHRRIVLDDRIDLTWERAMALIRYCFRAPDPGQPPRTGIHLLNHPWLKVDTLRRYFVGVNPMEGYQE